MNAICAADLETVISKLTEEYVEEIEEVLKKEAKATGKKIAETLKQTSPKGEGGIKGHYADGWTSKITSENMGTVQVTVYNRSKPGLIHLLEKGHANRGGGRTLGKLHVAPAAEKAEEEFVKRLEARL